MSVSNIAIASIECHADFFQPWSLEPGTTHDLAQISLYREALSAGRTPPAVLVYEMPSGRRYLADGRHRLCAYRALGFTEIPANVAHVDSLADALGGTFAAVLCRAECEDFLRQQGTGRRLIEIATIVEDRKYWFAVIAAIGGDPQRARPGHNAALIARYTKALAGGAAFPPITVVVEADGARFLYDGHHRLAAHKQLGRTQIEAILYHEKDFMGCVAAELPRSLSTGQRAALLWGK